jgi:predicted MFS family arabinose efflux permease
MRLMGMRFQLVARWRQPLSQVQLLLLLSFLFTIAYTSAFTLVPLVASDLGVSGVVAGVVIAAPGVLSLAFGPISAALSNRFGRRALLLTAFASLLGSGLGYLAAPSFVWLLPGQLVVGLAIILYWPSAIAALSELARFGEQEAVQGANTLVHGLASFAGVIASGFLVALVGFTGSFLAYSAIAALGFAVAMLVEETRDLRKLSLAAEFRSTLRGYRLLSHRRLTLMAAAGNFPWGVLWWVGGGSFFVLFTRDAGHPAVTAGLLLGLRTLIASGVRLRFGAFARRYGLVEVLLVGNLIGALGLALAPLAPSISWLAMSAVLQGLGLAFVPPASHTIVAYTTSVGDRALGQSMPIFFSQAAVFVMPPILGLAAEFGGLGLSIQLAAATAGVSVAAMWVLGGGSRARKEAAELIERT